MLSFFMQSLQTNEYIFAFESNLQKFFFILFPNRLGVYRNNNTLPQHHYLHYFENKNLTQVLYTCFSLCPVSVFQCEFNV